MGVYIKLLGRLRVTYMVFGLGYVDYLFRLGYLNMVFRLGSWFGRMFRSGY